MISLKSQTKAAREPAEGVNRRVTAARRRAGQRGAIAVEYAFLLVVVAIPTVAGVIAGGVKLLNDYDIGRKAILAPTP